MADVGVTVEGAEELYARLNAISEDMKKKGGRFALRKAANIIRDAARSNAERLDDSATSTMIHKNITTRWSNRTYKRTGDLNFRIGVLGGARSKSKSAEYSRRRRGGASLDDLGEFEGAGAGNPGGDTFYWRFLEFGTQNNPARPFMRPAATQNAQRAADEFIAQYNKALDRAIRRAAASGG